MTYHEWGDKSFDWKSLWEACNYIQKTTKRYSGLDVMMKEKYGTLRFEFIFLWGISEYKWISAYQFYILYLVIKRACRKWPHIKEEILEDLIIVADGKFKERLKTI